jgi:hypothetical protein
MASLSEAYDHIVLKSPDEHPAQRKTREAKQAAQSEREAVRAARLKRVGDWFRRWCCCVLPAAPYIEEHADLPVRLLPEDVAAAAAPELSPAIPAPVGDASLYKF